MGVGRPRLNGRVDQFYPGLLPRQGKAPHHGLHPHGRRAPRAAPASHIRVMQARKICAPVSHRSEKYRCRREKCNRSTPRVTPWVTPRAVAAGPLPAASTPGQPRCRRRFRRERRGPGGERISIGKPRLGLDAVGSPPYYPRTLRWGAGGRKPPKRSRVIGSWLCAARDGASIWSSH